jgi:hypothetical protein
MANSLHPASVDDGDSFGVIPLNDSHNRSFSHDLHLIIGQPENNRKGYDYPPARKTIPADG